MSLFNVKLHKISLNIFFLDPARRVRGAAIAPVPSAVVVAARQAAVRVAGAIVGHAPF